MAVELVVSLDRTHVAPSGGRVHLVVSVRGVARATVTRDERPPAWTVLALDVSHSMAGEPLEQVVRSVDFLVGALPASDHLGIVAFSDGASRVVDPVPVDAEGKRLVRGRVARLRPSGRTNVQAGLEAAAAMLDAAPAGARRAVVLLSDGAPNVGASTPAELRDLVARFRPAVSIASLGYGLDHQEDVLSAVGEAGGGGYELVLDPKACVRSFARVLGAQADVVARGVEVVLAPAEGATIERLVSGEALRFGREGLVVPIGDLANDARATVVAEVTLRAPGDTFLARVADVSVRHHDAAAPAGTAAASRCDEAVTIEVSAAPSRLVPEAAADVLLVRAERAREAARASADRGQFGAAVALLRAVMVDLAEHPSYRAGDGSPLSEAYELLLDEVTALERLPDAEQWSAFRKGAVASKIAGAVPSAPRSARARGDASARLLDLAAGDAPDAHVEITEGPGKGTRFGLRAECVIGRTASADIPVASASVSRRHAEIYAQGGAWFVTDLGSTSPTLVNGARLGTSPRALAEGDRIQVGEVILVYRSGPA